MEGSITQISNNRQSEAAENFRSGVQKAPIGIRGHRHCLRQSHLESQQAAAGTLFKEKRAICLLE